MKIAYLDHTACRCQSQDSNAESLGAECVFLASSLGVPTLGQ